MFVLQCLFLLSLHVLAEIKTQDAVFILAYAVIMLNTDQHSPNIRVSDWENPLSMTRHET